MINDKRIVPVATTDLISLYSVILAMASVSANKLEATTSDGEFTIASASGTYLANEPVKSLEITAGTSAVIYFVPALNFEGFTIAGTKVTTTGDDVTADCAGLYTATLSGGNAIAIAKKGF